MYVSLIITILPWKCVNRRLLFSKHLFIERVLSINTYQCQDSAPAFKKYKSCNVASFWWYFTPCRFLCIEEANITALWQTIKLNLQTPNINFRSIGFANHKQFWRCILRRATVGFQWVVISVDVTEAEIWNRFCSFKLGFFYLSFQNIVLFQSWHSHHSAKPKPYNGKSLRHFSKDIQSNHTCF